MQIHNLQLSQTLCEKEQIRDMNENKIKQMALQYIQNVGEGGTKKNSLLDYLKDVHPQRNSLEQNGAHGFFRGTYSELNTGRGK